MRISIVLSIIAYAITACNINVGENKPLVQHSDSLQIREKNCEEYYNLAFKYLLGDSVEKDTIKSIDLMRKAATKGYKYAESFLGYWYYANKNYSESIKWLTKASEKGEPEAQYLLGNCYLNGEGCNKDTLIAIKWYNQACEECGFDDAGRMLHQLGVKPWPYATFPFVKNNKYYLPE